MLGSRTLEDAMAGMEWLYGEQTELGRGGVARAASESSGVTRTASAKNRLR
jgi:hypothetical protein